MSRYIFYIIIIYNLLLFNNNSLANYNDAVVSYNNKDWPKALEICGSDLKDYRCLNLLGVIYLNGLGIENNYVKAKQYFIEAKNLGSKSAEFNLGWMALKGLGEEINLDSASEYFNNYNSNNKNIIKNNNDLEISLEDNLVKLKKNNLISKYGYFYTNYIKLERLLNSKINIEKKIISNISPIKNKLNQFDKILVEKNTNINTIKNIINREQEIIIKLLLLELDKDPHKFKKTINQLYSVLQNFNIDDI